MSRSDASEPVMTRPAHGPAGSSSLGDREIIRAVEPSRFGKRYLAVDHRRGTDCMVWRFDAVSGDDMPKVWRSLKQQVGERRSHILPIEAVGRERGGSCWAVTSFVGNHDGVVTIESLRAARGGSMTFFETVRAVEQLLDASVRAHDSGVVHGPIDASEVLVTPRGTLEIAMYGLARSIVSRRDDEAARLAELRSIASIGWNMLALENAPVARSEGQQGRPLLALRAWLRRVDDAVGGFESAAEAQSAFSLIASATNESGALDAARSILGRIGAVVGASKAARNENKRKKESSIGIGKQGEA